MPTGWLADWPARKRCVGALTRSTDSPLVFNDKGEASLQAGVATSQHHVQMFRRCAAASPHPFQLLFYHSQCVPHWQHWRYLVAAVAGRAPSARGAAYELLVEEVVERELLQKHMTVLLSREGSGCSALLAQDRGEDDPDKRGCLAASSPVRNRGGLVEQLRPTWRRGGARGDAFAPVS